MEEVIRSRNRHILCSVLVLVAPSLVVAQGAPNGATVARENAPVLWLVNGEPAYPMRPFPFAFDGIDNDEDGCYDVEDPDEVEALELPSNATKEMKREKLEAVRSLLLALLRLRDDRADPQWLDLVDKSGLRVRPELVVGKDCTRNHRKVASSVVEISDFRLCEEVRINNQPTMQCGPEPAVFFDYRDDANQDRLGAKSLRFLTDLQAIQYWMYYPWDDEHLHDGEHVSIFRNADVQGVAGAGHLPSTANNLLVRDKKDHYPLEIPAHTIVLVEMGKHSSAPDYNCNGRFDIGQDANYLPTGAWGTRDINYATAKSQWGKYENFYSFDRAGGTMLLEESASDAPSREEYLKVCHDHSLGKEMLREILSTPEPGPDPRGAQAGQYRLSRQLSPEAAYEPHVWMKYKLIDGDAFAQILADEQLQSAIVKNWGLFFPSFRPVNKDVVLSPVFSDLAKRVSEAARSAAPRPDVWNHSDFGEYKNDFKAYLFRNFATGPSYTVENGNARFGWFVRWAAFIDSSLEAHVWFDRLSPRSVPGAAEAVANANAVLFNEPKGRPVEVALYYNSFSTSYRGLYGGLSFRSSDLAYERQTLFPRGSSEEADGIDFVRRIRLPRNLFAEAGYSASVPWDRIPFLWGGLKRFLEKRPLQARLGVTGPLTWNRASVSEAEEAGLALVANKRAQAVEFRLSLQFRLGNLGSGGGHPFEK